MATWQERCDPLMKKLRELNGRCTWEGYATLNLDRPRQKDIIVQHWCVPKQGEKEGCDYYIVRIYGDGSGWDVFAPLTDDPTIRGVLDALEAASRA